MLGANNRLRLESDYRRVYRVGSRRFSNHFCVTVAPLKDPVAQSRFGIVISKKISKKAVVRNGLKRQIASVVQEFLKDRTNVTTFDAIISPKSGAPQLPFATIRTELLSLLGKRPQTHSYARTTYAKSSQRPKQSEKRRK